MLLYRIVSDAELLLKETYRKMVSETKKAKLKLFYNNLPHRSTLPLHRKAPRILHSNLQLSANQWLIVTTSSVLNLRCQDKDA